MMAEGQQEDRGIWLRCHWNLIFVLSRCSIIPKFDLLRLQSRKSPSFRASNQISPTDLASYSKHSWILGTLPRFSRPHDSRLTFHLRPLPSSWPSRLSSSSRITSSLWIWAVLLTAISSTETWTPASLAAEIRGLSSVQWSRGRIFWFGNINLNMKDELVEWIWFQCDCTGMDLKTLIKSHCGCTKLTLSIRSWHAPEHQEAGDSRLDWWSLMNSHSRWWSTSPS